MRFMRHELKTADTNLVELLDKEHTEAVGTDEPDSKAKRDESQVSSPVRQTIIAMNHSSPQ
jgi:hypothetical protein